jgi:copper chaperone CopZ
LNRGGRSFRITGVLQPPSGRESSIHFSRKFLPICLAFAGGFSRVAAAVEAVDLRVEGIQCSLCVTTIERLIGEMPGVAQVTVLADPWRLEASALSGRSLDLQAIRKQLTRSGYKPDEDEMITAGGMVVRGTQGHLTFKVPGANEEFDLLEGAQLRALLQALPASAPARVTVRARVHRHPASLPPSLSILSFEVETKQ